jgi:uncharacterized membrane protein
LIALVDGFVFGYSTATPTARAAVGLFVVLFVPGYLLLAVLFPGRHAAVSGDGPVTSARSTPRRLAEGGTPTWTERLLLSFGVSLAIVPLLGLLVAPLSGSLSTRSVVVALNVFVGAGLVVALIRRNLAPADERLRVPVRAAMASLGRAFSGKGNADRVLTVVFVVGMVAAVGTLGFVVLSPAQGEAYTGVSLLTENEDGELLASGYPDTVGDGETLTLRIENDEGVETTYTAVAVLQRVEGSGASVDVTERERLFEREVTLSPGASWTTQHAPQPEMSGTDLRLRYFVYRGEAPENANADSAYRTLSLWVSTPE